MHFHTALLALLPAALAAPTAEPLDKRAPVIAAQAGRVVPGKYVVKLKEGASDDALDKAVKKLSKTDHVYRSRKFKGFAGKLEGDLLDEIRRLPDVSKTMP
jgi:hypothetical protein